MTGLATKVTTTPTLKLRGFVSLTCPGAEPYLAAIYDMWETHKGKCIAEPLALLADFMVERGDPRGEYLRVAQASSVSFGRKNTVGEYLYCFSPEGTGDLVAKYPRYVVRIPVGPEPSSCPVIHGLLEYEGGPRQGQWENLMPWPPKGEGL